MISLRLALNHSSIIKHCIKAFSIHYNKNLIETEELNKIITDKEKIKHVRILDCTWFLPEEKLKDAKKLFAKERIPYSQFFEIDEIADKSNDISHMMPNQNHFIQEMKKMDIRKSDNVICYDRLRIFSSPRVWYTFKIFGHPKVMVLNGGFNKWSKEKRPLEKLQDFRIKEQNIIRSKPKPNDFNYIKDEKKILNLKEIIEISVKKTHNKSDHSIIDCRPGPRYEGKAPEPRPSLRRGHIGGASNICFKDMFDERGCYKKPKELEKEFHKKGIDMKKIMNFYCGSGLSACNVLLGATLLGKYDNCRLYDGSWSEIGNIHEKDLEKLKRKVAL